MSASPSPAVNPFDFTEPTDDIPLSIEPVLGWRVWRLIERPNGELMLGSLTRPDAWPAGQSMEATCGRSHQSPGESCGCGLYAAASINALAAAHVFHSGVGVIGAIAMWGKVIEHQRGARSKFAYPARLRLVCAPCLQMRRVEDPDQVVGDIVSLVPMCSFHLKAKGAKGAPAAEIQSKLLSTYGVELLPKPKLPWVSRSGISVPPGSAGMRVLSVIGILIRFLLGAVIALFFWGGMLLLALSIVRGVVSSIFGWNDPAPLPVASMTYPTRIAVPTAFGPSAVEHGHRRPVVPPPPPVPEMAFPCGDSHGTWIQLVRCTAPNAELLGIGERSTPTGHLEDCFGVADAYSTGDHWWVCWLSVSHTWVSPKATSPNPFKAARDVGGVIHGDR